MQFCGSGVSTKPLTPQATSSSEEHSAGQGNCGFYPVRSNCRTTYLFRTLVANFDVFLATRSEQPTTTHHACAPQPADASSLDGLAAYISLPQRTSFTWHHPPPVAAAANRNGTRQEWRQPAAGLDRGACVLDHKPH